MPNYLDRREWTYDRLVSERESAVVRLQREQKEVERIDAALKDFNHPNGNGSVEHIPQLPGKELRQSQRWRTRQQESPDVLRRGSIVLLENWKTPNFEVSYDPLRDRLPAQAGLMIEHVESLFS